jgi:hypothetical protein
VSTAASPHRPIGYWLKEADRLITERVNAVQAANGVTRTQWQVLNMLHEGDSRQSRASANRTTSR